MSNRLMPQPVVVGVGCAYILGIGAAGQRCDLPRQPRSSYCREHHALCHLASGTSAETARLREVEALARAVGGRQGWHGAAPSRPFLERLSQAVRALS
jgi:hypothetical protein